MQRGFPVGSGAQPALLAIPQFRPRPAAEPANRTSLTNAESDVPTAELSLRILPSPPPQADRIGPKKQRLIRGKNSPFAGVNKNPPSADELKRFIDEARPLSTVGERRYSDNEIHATLNKTFEYWFHMSREQKTALQINLGLRNGVLERFVSDNAKLKQN
jgi:hypothetical protein